MNAGKLTDYSKLCVHTITTKPWSVEEAAENYSSAGITAISVWRDTLEGRNIQAVGEQLHSHGLSVVSLVRGGFFSAVDATDRHRAIEDNKRAIDEASELGSPLVVLVCGASPHQPLGKSREQIRKGIERILPYAEENNVKLAIEPLQPMYADCRSAINTMKQANELAEYYQSPYVGVAVDVYHVWWDPELETEIIRAGRNGNLYAFHICDWLTPTTDILNDRGLMGDGCIPIRKIRGWMNAAGFDGYHEVEIFSNKHWAEDQHAYLEKIKKAYIDHS
jgi:sugar phosphate isomerase/epimerase